jgi:hypothetical protein
VGSLIATWLTQHTSASLILLGRSGRLAKDSAVTAASFGNACVTIARSDVAAVEEAAYTLESARLHSQPLQACTPSSFRIQNRRSMVSLVNWAPFCISE